MLDDFVTYISYIGFYCKKEKVIDEDYMKRSQSHCKLAQNPKKLVTFKAMLLRGRVTILHLTMLHLTI